MPSEPYRVPPPGVAAPPVYTPEELAQQAARDKARTAKRKRKDAARTRWALLNRFVDEGMAGLELSDVAVWVALFRNAGADGVATVARARLEALTGCKHNTLTVALRRLINAGWVARLRRGGPSGGCAVYRVQHPKEVGQ